MPIRLKNSVGFRINKLANRINSVFNQILQPFDIAIEQRVALEIIKNDEEVTTTKISNILSKDKTTMSRTLKTLENKGFIKRDKIEKDRRSSYLQLTKKGEETLSDSEKISSEFRQSLLKNLTKEEQGQLFELLEKVNLGLEEIR